MTEILPAGRAWRRFEGVAPDVITVSAVDRAGGVSAPAGMAAAAPGKRPLPENKPSGGRRHVRKIISPKGNN
jgi:hypothetical protein